MANQIKAQFIVNYNKRKLTFEADRSWSLLSAVLTDKSIKKYYEANANKYLLFRRQKDTEVDLGGNFPCSLLKNKEELCAEFINCNSEDRKKTVKTESPSNDLKMFYVNVKGGEGIQNRVITNKDLRKEVEKVCIVATNGQRVKDALRNDGRFAEGLMTMNIALKNSEDHETGWEHFVNELKENCVYTVVRVNKESVPNSLEMIDSDGENSGAACAPSSNNSNEPEKPRLASNDELVTTQPIKINGQEYRPIPFTEGTVENLKTQFGSVMKQFKNQNKLRTNVSREKLFNALRGSLADKTRCFSKIEHLKILMNLSDSVCKICSSDGSYGTGFLIREGYVLTNAHVVTLNKQGDSPYQKDVTPHPDLKALFYFEGSRSPLELKVDCIKAYFYNGSLDFALLKLEESNGISIPIIPQCEGEAGTDGICIIGHPGGCTKEIDFSIIFQNQEQQNAAVLKHMNEYPHFFQIIGEKYFKDVTHDPLHNQIRYETCFYEGSSGSPVFDGRGHIIGMHSGGYMCDEKAERGGYNNIVEYAQKLSPIVDEIRFQWPEFLNSP